MISLSFIHYHTFVRSLVLLSTNSIEARNFGFFHDDTSHIRESVTVARTAVGTYRFVAPYIIFVTLDYPMGDPCIFECHTCLITLAHVILYHTWPFSLTHSSRVIYKILPIIRHSLKFLCL